MDRINRRHFLLTASAALAALPYSSRIAQAAERAPDLRLRIELSTFEIAKGVSISTITYNGQLPGPTLRLRKNHPITIDVTNATSTPDLVHWHGLTTDPLNDGAVEEGSPLIPAGATHRYHLTPNPSGTRWYHTHAMAMADLTLAAYTGQFGFLLIDGEPNPGRYDREVELAIHHWGAHFVPMLADMRAQSENHPQTTGSDVGYTHATINAHTLGHGDPIRVRPGERILFRLLNASATENVTLALPGHTFHVVAMDGNPVPTARSVETLSLAVAERIDAIVEMSNPGTWILGSTHAAARTMGLGIVVEYANRTGSPIWRDPQSTAWDYTQFAATTPTPTPPQQPDETIPLTIRDAGALNGSPFDTFTINGESWPTIKPIEVKRGKRYRLLFRNATGDQHPMHLHRHSFELTRIDDTFTSGLLKDTINVMPLQTLAVDFTADNPGDSLLHCHQQLHMDYGFMQLIRYVD